MTEYITAITFPQTSTTYEAFSKLSGAAGQYGVRSAGIIERDAQGHLKVPSRATPPPVLDSPVAA